MGALDAATQGHATPGAFVVTARSRAISSNRVFSTLLGGITNSYRAERGG